jgi:membrane protein DedA with SNARE-associated domain/rhodanese-related sulfurtransferase
MYETWQQIAPGNGYILLFLVILADQAGLPIPAAPALVYAGVLARSGSVHVPWVLGITVIASLLGHGAWYLAGRRRGAAIIKLLCRLSFEPDACVRRTEELFKHVGPTSLLWVRFIPGLDVLAQPLVAMAGMPWPNYVAITTLGALLWSGVLMAAGFALGQTGLHDLLQGAGASLLSVGVVGVAAYVVYKLVLRLLSRSRDVPRMEPAELLAMLEAGRPIVIIDLRTSGELARSKEHIAGAKHLSRRELRALAHHPVPGWGAVVLCECPKEAGSAYMAAVLKRGGWQESWALVGGFTGWKQAGYPTRAIAQEGSDGTNLP